MTPPLAGPCPPASPRGLAALVALALCLLAPGAAHAGCGDHVRLGSETPGKPGSGQGPGCSRGDDPTPLTPPTTPARSFDHEAMTVSGLDLPAPPGHDVPPTRPAGRPVHRTTPTDPPPRQAA